MVGTFSVFVNADPRKTCMHIVYLSLFISESHLLRAVHLLGRVVCALHGLESSTKMVDEGTRLWAFGQTLWNAEAIIEHGSELKSI